MGDHPTAFRVDLGMKRAKQVLPFDHVFHPEATLPEEAF